MRIGLLIFGIALTSACHTTPGGLNATAHSPDGDITEPVKAISVTFDQRVVKDADVMRDQRTGPLAIAPSIAGVFRWVDPQKLVFLPDAPLTKSTEYRVAIDSSLRTSDGKGIGDGFAWSFRTERIAVSRGLDKDAMASPVGAQLRIETNQPVRTRDAQAQCYIEDKDKKQTVVTVEESPTPVKVLRFTATAPLIADQDFSLVCKKELRGAEGTLGMKDEYRATFHTYGQFRVVEVKIGGKAPGQNVDPDEALLEIEFSTPFDSEKLSKQLKSTPTIDGIQSGSHSDGSRRKFRAKMKLLAQTDYSITLANGAGDTGAMADEIGQTLKEPLKIDFRTGDAHPRLAIKNGLHLIEASLPRFPVWSRNITKLELEAARISDDKIVPMLLAGSYDMWRESSITHRYDGEIEDNGKKITRGLGAFVKAGGLKVKKQTLPLKNPKNRWSGGSFDLANLSGGGPATGLFVFSVYSSEEKSVNRGITAITNLGLTAKVGAASGVVWATHLDTGKPAPNVKVTIRNAANAPRFTGVTDGDGMLKLPPVAVLTGAKPPKPAAAGHDEEFSEERGDSPDNVYVIAREGDDVSVVAGDWREGLQSWNFNLPESSAPSGTMRGFLQTDRGLYRPAETVHIKGLVRTIDAATGLHPPAGIKKVQVVVQNPRGDEVLKLSPALTQFGGFSIDVPLDAEAPLGDWDVIATVGGKEGATTFRDHFAVQEYRPTSFEVKLAPERQSVLLGENVKVNIDGNYLYGAPLAGAKVSLSAQRRDYFPSFKGYEGYSFTDYNAFDDMSMWWSRDGERSYTNELTTQDTTLDKNGKATLSFRAADPKEEIKTAQDILITATVTDASNQSRDASTVVVAHRGPLYVGLQTDEWVPQVGKPFDWKVVALDENGRPKKVDAELLVVLRTWTCGYGTGTGGYYSYRCDQNDKELERRKVTIGESAAPTVIKTTPTVAGTLLVSLKANDGKGHDVLASQTVWATGDGEAAWRDSEDNHFSIIASAKRYKAGETARLVAQTPMKNAMALITVEREGVISAKVQPFSSASPIAIPLTDKMAPNVYASIVLVAGRSGEGLRGLPKMRMGLVNLEVDATAKKLVVKVSTDKPSYRPAETVKARVEVRDLDGKPVTAEVALAAADEGVLQLIGFKTPDPLGAFYAAYGDSVQTSSNIGMLIVGEDDKLDNDDSDGEGGDGGNQSGHLRKKFLSTAFWAPALVTDANGVVDVTFVAPDNLTAFRLMATAADSTDRFGSTDTRMTTAKPLQAQPALPRFLTIGDKAQVGVVLHNDTGTAGKVALTAKVDGVVMKGDKDREVQVPSGETRSVLFDVEADKVGQGKFTFVASLGGEKDAIEVTIPIVRPEVSEVAMLGEGEAKDTVSIPTVLAMVGSAKPPSEGDVEVIVDSSGLSSLDESLRYLIGYPYGCLEQTTSRVVPMVMVDELGKTLDLAAITGQKANLKRYVEAGVAKVLKHQHGDGAFSLWPHSATEPFLTAFAIYGLEQARRGGYKVPARVIEDGVASLKTELKSEREMGHSDNPLGEEASRAFSLYVLTELGQAEPGLTSALYEKRSTLPAYGKAFLAKAIAKQGGSREQIDTLINEVMGFAKPAPSGDGVLVFDPAQASLWWFMSSDVRTTAITVLALLDAAPQHKSLDALVKGLLSTRQAGRWESTEDNFWALVALASYGKQKNANSNLTAKLALGDKVLIDGALGKGASVKRVHFKLSELGANKLQLTPSGGAIHYTARVRYSRSLEKADAAEHGLRVERKILEADKDVEKTAIKAGDLVRVQLTVYATEQRNRVALVDYLPAAFEPINPKIDRRDDDNADYEGEGEGEGGGRDYTWVGLEQHDTHVAVFADAVHPTGANRFEYLARATTAGTFILPAATVEEMYRPTQNGRTAATTITVTPR